MSVLTRAPKRPSWAVTVLAGALVWLALVAPDGAGPLSPRDLARIPLEGLLVLTLALVLPPRARRGMALLAGLLLGLLTIVRLLDAVFFAALGRPFSPAADWAYFGSGVGLLASSVGRLGAALSVLAAVALGVALMVVMPLAVVRLTQLIDRHRATSARALTALGVAWLLCTVLGVELVPGAPVAATGEARLAYTKVTQARADARAQRAFAMAAELDPLRSTRDADLLTGLRGKDVIVAFVESYGRVAVQGSPFSASVDSALDAGTSRLRKAGFSSRSAFLTSPTFGGISWLAHSTLQSGLWVDSQRRYDDLMATDRATLSATFKRAGWRTVGDVPSNRQDWPDGTSFYRYDTVYDARNVGYAGPGFSYASMPDQYVLSAFQRLELDKPGHRPVMAEIDLVSSHTPWTPLPHLLDWGDVGNGSVFSTMDGGPPPQVVWRDPDQVRAAYAKSIEYSLSTLISFVLSCHDSNDLVLVVLGDHQPATVVSGPGASHDVPITVIARDPAVMSHISGWGWQDGLRPHPDAPVWRMDAFRDRFLTAFGPPPPPATPARAAPAQR